MVDGELLNKIYLKLIKNNYKIATAESCTGGLVGHSITNISGISDYFEMGIISYSNKSKIELLDVPKELIIRHGAVSREVALAMAEGVRKKYGLDIGLSTTGIAGPTGGTKDKPVGLVFIGLSLKNKSYVEKYIFKGNRIENKESTCEAALKMLNKYI